MKKLLKKEIEAKMTGIPGWKHEKGMLKQKYEFSDHIEAFGFLSRVAMFAEKLNHHPDYSGSYNKVNLKLTTHDAGGVTDKDLELARGIDAILGSTGAGKKAGSADPAKPAKKTGRAKKA